MSDARRDAFYAGYTACLARGLHNREHIEAACDDYLQSFDPATAPYCRKHRIYKKAVPHYFCEECYKAGEAMVGPASAHDTAPAATEGA